MNRICTKIEPDTKIKKLLYTNFTNTLLPGYVQVGEDKISMPLRYDQIKEEIENFEVRDDDIFVISFPKSGTTWAQELVWRIVNPNDNKTTTRLSTRSPFLESTCIFDYTEVCKADPDFVPPQHIQDSINIAKNHPSKLRIIKTHIPWGFLPKQIRDRTKNPKIIYVTRNPKDTFVSYYYHCTFMQGYNGSFEEFATLFLSNLLLYSPLFAHINSFYTHQYPNIYHLTYEEMSRDLPSTILRVSSFLGCPFSASDPQVENIASQLSFKTMREHSTIRDKEHRYVNSQFFVKKEGEWSFLRKGKVGAYKEEMSEEMVKKFDEWTEENLNKYEGLREYLKEWKKFQ